MVGNDSNAPKARIPGRPIIKAMALSTAFILVTCGAEYFTGSMLLGVAWRVVVFVPFFLGWLYFYGNKKRQHMRDGSWLVYEEKPVEYKVQAFLTLFFLMIPQMLAFAALFHMQDPPPATARTMPAPPASPR